MKIILEDQEINIINRILTDFPIKELTKVQQIMNIMDSKIEKEESPEEPEESDS